MSHDCRTDNNRHCSLVNSEGAVKNSIAVAAAPIVSRAILLDFPRALDIPWFPEDHAITIKEIEDTLPRQGVHIEPGDILLFGTGHLTRFLASRDWIHYTYTNSPTHALEVPPWVHPPAHR